MPFQLGDSDPMERGRIIPKAIVGRRSPGVSYNRGEGPAPDIRYRRHAGFEAVPIERSGAASREARFGMSELSGLGQLALTDQTFDPAADRYAGVTLLAV